MKNDKNEVDRPRLVLFVGTPTASYAPVAALWFGALAADSKAKIVLAYADNALAMLSPEMVVALSENGLDPRRLIARSLTPELLDAADLVVTLSSGRQSRMKVAATARRREHWTIPDTTAKPSPKAGKAGKAGKTAAARAPKRDGLADARALRDALRARVAMLVFSEGWGRREISREDARVTRVRSGARVDEFLPGPAVAGRSGAFTPGLVPEVTPAWFPQPSLVPPSLR